MLKLGFIVISLCQAKDQIFPHKLLFFLITWMCMNKNMETAAQNWSEPDLSAV